MDIFVVTNVDIFGNCDCAKESLPLSVSKEGIVLETQQRLPYRCAFDKIRVLYRSKWRVYQVKCAGVSWNEPSARDTAVVVGKGAYQVVASVHCIALVERQRERVNSSFCRVE